MADTNDAEALTHLRQTTIGLLGALIDLRGMVLILARQPTLSLQANDRKDFVDKFESSSKRLDDAIESLNKLLDDRSET